MQTEALYDTLNSVTAIPIVPFEGGAIDLEGHRKNIRYLMENNHLDGGRKRVTGIAGTSLIHHFSVEDQMRLIRATGEEMGDDGFLMSGIVPNPLTQAEELVRRQSALPRPPDVYLLMPLTGVADHEATYGDYMAFAERLGAGCGARFLMYMRSADYVNPIIRLVRDSPHVVGVGVNRRCGGDRRPERRRLPSSPRSSRASAMPASSCGGSATGAPGPPNSAPGGTPRALPSSLPARPTRSTTPSAGATTRPRPPWKPSFQNSNICGS